MIVSYQEDAPGTEVMSAVLVGDTCYEEYEV